MSDFLIAFLLVFLFIAAVAAISVISALNPPV